MTGRCSATGRTTRAAPDVAPVLDWSAYPGPLGGLLAAVEMCNNNGTCRAFHAGSMCPSYRVTRDEQHLTRGRANTLRLALTGQLGPDALAGDEVAEALKLCVSCKACKRECPTGVDMAKMKIEALAARAARHGVGLRERLVAELPRYAGTGGRFAPLVNLRNRSAAAAPACPSVGSGFAAERPLPEWSSRRFRAEAGAAGAARRRAAARRHVQPGVRAGEPARRACACWRRPGIAPWCPRGRRLLRPDLSVGRHWSTARGPRRAGHWRSSRARCRWSGSSRPAC